MAFDVVEAGQRLAKAMLESRDVARQQQEAALAVGDQREVRKWATELRKTEKLIAQYGLDRDA